ncbi:MAG: hypothetical protein AAFY88_10955 [Acidobacteriota bacterium]
MLSKKNVICGLILGAALAILGLSHVATPEAGADDFEAIVSVECGGGGFVVCSGDECSGTDGVGCSCWRYGEELTLQTASCDRPILLPE